MTPNKPKLDSITRDKKKWDMDLIFTKFLKNLSRRGFYYTIQLVKSSGKNGLHYNEILHLLLNEDVVKSRATVTIILNTLTDMKMLTRTVTDTRPIRTVYHTTIMGNDTLDLILRLRYRLL